MALLGSGAALTASPAQSVPPTEDCAKPLLVDDVTAGMAVDTLSVTKGTTPESFSGEVIGVLNDGIAPGVDMILADFASPAGDTKIDKVGIWQGMSGSPVYDAEGNLLGAVAYGLSWGPSTVAGITPYEKMDDYMPGTTGTAQVEVSPSMARTIAEATDVTARQADNGLSRLRVPLTISGISKERLRQGREERGYITRKGRAGTLVGTASTTVAADAADVIDGGNLGAAISYGTITAGGVGTVTDVCASDVVGFGHPMMFSGATSMGLMPADALYIQPDSLGSGFKVANLGEPAGTITQDRLTGVTGALGATPTPADITTTVNYGGRTGEGLSHSLAKSWHADVTFMQLLSMHDVTIDAIQPGSENAGVVIVGSADGESFEIDWSDRYVSDFDIAFESLWGTADLVWILSRMSGVEITSITTTGDVSDSTDVWKLTGVQQLRSGRWVTVNRRNPAIVKAGSTATFRSKLTEGDMSRWVEHRVAVPSSAREGYLEVAGGASTWNDGLYEAETVDDVQKALAEDVRNDAVRARLLFWTRRGEVRSDNVSEPQDLVVTGQREAPVFVRR